MDVCSINGPEQNAHFFVDVTFRVGRIYLLNDFESYKFCFFFLQVACIYFLKNIWIHRTDLEQNQTDQFRANTKHHVTYHSHSLLQNLTTSHKQSIHNFFCTTILVSLCRPMLKIDRLMNIRDNLKLKRVFVKPWNFSGPMKIVTTKSVKIMT